MKILAISYLFPNKLYPNYGIFVLNRLVALQKYCEIKVINPIPWFPFHFRFSRYRDFNKIPKAEIIQGLDVFHPRFPILPRVFKSLDCISYSLAVIPLALQLRKTFSFELIDLHWTYPDLPAGYILSRIVNKKFIVTIRGKEALYLREGGLRKRIVPFTLRKSEHVITLSNELRDLCINFGCSESLTSTIRNGVNGKKFSYIGKEIARKKLHIPLDEYMILSIGSLIYGKGFDRIIKALPAISNRNPKARLYIIGSEGAAGFYANELYKLISELKLEAYVRLVGEIPNSDLLYWYNAADIFCLASRGEGSPNVLLEALSCGCPSLSTDVGSAREILAEEFMGEIVPNRDDAMGTGLVSMLDREFDRKKIADYMKQYDWDWCARKVLHVYKRAMKKPA